MKFIATYSATLTVLLASSLTFAAEVHFQEQSAVTGSLVKLGDIAQIYSENVAEQQSLAAMELFPAPAAGRSRTIRAQEIIENLALRGVRVDQMRFSGKSVLQISGPGVSSPAVDTSDYAAKNTRRFEQVAKTYLTQQGVDLSLHTVAIKPQSQAALESLPPNASLRAEGVVQAGHNCTIDIVAQTGNQVSRIPVTVEYEAMEQAVVFVRTKHRGEMVTAADVRLEPVSNDALRENVVRNLDEVIGKEIARTVTNGRAATAADVRAPILVKRNEVVSVYARGSGFTVRTTAISMEEGSHGALINVKSHDKKREFVARVTGSQEVEVLVATPQVVAQPTQAATAQMNHHRTNPVQPTTRQSEYRPATPTQPSSYQPNISAGQPARQVQSLGNWNYR